MYFPGDSAVARFNLRLHGHHRFTVIALAVRTCPRPATGRHMGHTLSVRLLLNPLLVVNVSSVLILNMLFGEESHLHRQNGTIRLLLERVVPVA